MVHEAPKIQLLVGALYYFLIDVLTSHLNALKREICCPDLLAIFTINALLRYWVSSGGLTEVSGKQERQSCSSNIVEAFVRPFFSYLLTLLVEEEL